MDNTLDIINNSGAFVKGRSQFIKEVLREKVVDLGLPSGLKWAVCDIDVTQEDGFCKTPFTYQKSFFSWGNVEGHNPKNNSFVEVYDWGGINAAEPWYEGQVYGSTKGNALTENIPVDEEYDAARTILGLPWRMPTMEEFEELFANCIFINADGTEVDTSKDDKRVSVNGIVGLYLQSKGNDNRIFLSASGLGDGTSWSRHGLGGRGYYWSASYSSSRYAHSLYFYNVGVNPQNNNVRHLGFAIRAVHE